jgi:hypothetical protein
MFAEILGRIDATEAEADKSNPLSRRFPADRMNYHYVPSHTTDEGVKVTCCYSCWKNVAGCYLSWVERTGEKGGSRKQHVAHKTRKAARACAERWAKDLRP